MLRAAISSNPWWRSRLSISYCIQIQAVTCLVPLLLLNRLVLPAVYPRLEFLPLMLTSVYCAVGLLASFLVYVWINTAWLMEERLVHEEQMAEDEYYRVKAEFFKKRD